MTIKSNTFTFLQELKKNNTREWFQEHKEEYDLANQNVKEFIEGMITRLAEFDLHINTDIKASKCLFRIYRDIRFSKDKTPYKYWFAAGISIDGRKLDGPEYYVHFEPGNNFIAAGYWRPKKAHLDAIRQEIDYNAADLIKALAAGGWVVTDLSQEDKLVRPPAGYSIDDPNIELLKLKSYILYKKFSDEELKSTDALDKVVAACQTIYPFKVFIHNSIADIA